VRGVQERVECRNDHAEADRGQHVTGESYIGGLLCSPCIQPRVEGRLLMPLVHLAPAGGNRRKSPKRYDWRGHCNIQVAPFFVLHLRVGMLLLFPFTSLR